MATMDYYSTIEMYVNDNLEDYHDIESYTYIKHVPIIVLEKLCINTINKLPQYGSYPEEHPEHVDEELADYYNILEIFTEYITINHLQYLKDSIIKYLSDNNIFIAPHDYEMKIIKKGVENKLECNLKK
jgi:hypothetical protein